jgi:uncharacterized protein
LGIDRRARLTRTDGRVVCERLLVAARPLTRMKGLLGRPHLPAGEGILLRPAGAVHTFFMRFAIDVVYVDDELAVVGIAPALPWRLSARRGELDHGLRAAGECDRLGLAVGDRLSLAPAG